MEDIKNNKPRKSQLKIPGKKVNKIRTSRDAVDPLQVDNALKDYLAESPELKPR